VSPIARLTLALCASANHGAGGTDSDLLTKLMAAAVSLSIAYPYGAVDIGWTAAGARSAGVPRRRVTCPEFTRAPRFVAALSVESSRTLARFL
jgi:hypothetical protein